jgi:hypothetical protein
MGKKYNDWILANFISTINAVVLGVLFFVSAFFLVIPCDFVEQCSELGNAITSVVEFGMTIFRAGCTFAFTTLMPPTVYSIIGNIMSFGWDTGEMMLWMAWVWTILMFVSICTFTVALFQGFKNEYLGGGNLLTLTFFLYVFAASLPFLAWYLIFTDSGSELFEIFARGYLPYILTVD